MRLAANKGGIIENLSEECSVKQEATRVEGAPSERTKTAMTAGGRRGTFNGDSPWKAG